MPGLIARASDCELEYNRHSAWTASGGPGGARLPQRRDEALPLTADCSRSHRVGPALRGQRALRYAVRQGRVVEKRKLAEEQQTTGGQADATTKRSSILTRRCR